jgi:hypothetical protein
MAPMPIFNGTLHEIDMNETKRYAGLKADRPFPDAVVAEACAAVQVLAAPRGIFRQCGYDPQAHELLCDEPFTIEGSQIRRHLGDAEIAIVMAVTIGSAIEDEIDRLFQTKEYTKGLLMDAAATTATEMIADQLNNYIDNITVKKGYKTTWRYSPGYGDWPLSQQPAMVRAIHADQIGITVTSSCMLVPRKSVTAIIGLKRTDAGPCEPSGCAGCTMHGTCASSCTSDS